jgi:hypothetical protein
MTRRQLVTSVLATFLVVLFSGSLAWAGIEPQPFRTGLFGVTAGQSVRISVLNAEGARGVINPCFRIRDAAGKLLFETEGGSLQAGIGTFADFVPVPEDGAPPPTGAPAPGVPLAPLASRIQLRVEVAIAWQPVPEDGRLACVPVPDDGRPACGPVPDDGRPACTPVPDDGRPACAPVPDDGQPACEPVPDDGRLCRVLPNVIPTLEVFDTATGRTVYTMPFAKVAFNPQPEPPEPVAGR